MKRQAPDSKTSDSKTNAEHVAIELIVTDYMMPEMNGLELIEKVRAMPAMKDIPILMAWAHSDMSIVSKAKSLGCNGFLVKPIDRKQLIERVTHLLKDPPLVPRDKNYMMNKLNMEPGEYDDLAVYLRLS
ncbi:MAG: response regulator [Nitrospira sp. CG24E]|nr:MAG: response regulator [Nitrospira sp. CG24E]